MLPKDHAFTAIADKVIAGQRLSSEDGLLLAHSADLPALGLLANYASGRQTGDQVFYNINRHVNPTNVCCVGCELCAYADDPKAEGTWSYTPEQCVNIAKQGFTPQVTEFHIVGGLHPHWKFPVYLEILSALKTAFPTVHLKAFTMVEIDFLSRLSGLSVADTIERLKQAGLESCTGGGAEIFDPQIRSQIASRKMSGERWLDVAGQVHAAGIRSNCTMLFGHIEKPEHWVDHLIKLREQQDRSGGFQCFIPLAFHPANTKFAHLPGPNMMTKLKVIALSRLMLDNISYIKAYWVMLGREIAQLALRFGANDLDGTVVDERVTLAAGGEAGKGMTVSDITEFIQGAGLQPVQRNTLYERVAD